MAQRPCAATTVGGWKTFEGMDEAIVLLEEMGFGPTFGGRLKALQEDARTMVVKVRACDGARDDPAFHATMLKLFGHDFPTPGVSAEEHSRLQSARQDRAAYRLVLGEDFIGGLIARLRSVPTIADGRSGVGTGNGSANRRGRPKGSKKPDDLDRFVKREAKALKDSSSRIPVKDLIDKYKNESQRTVTNGTMRGRMRKELGRLS
jgi:hypothetical protein